MIGGANNETRKTNSWPQTFASCANSIRLLLPSEPDASATGEGHAHATTRPNADGRSRCRVRGSRRILHATLTQTHRSSHKRLSLSPHHTYSPNSASS